ncbi:hypothetical protein [uncultured Dialister sp.]|nr:hypothetical protein [uncultured Dialister sp.]
MGLKLAQHIVARGLYDESLEKKFLKIFDICGAYCNWLALLLANREMAG